jgi:PTH1 family peptidyl-tRNA hydrolase
MWMIVGLGNPGAKYAFNRHNIGFLTVDVIHESFGRPSWKAQEKAQVCKIDWNGKPCLLVKPQTFMNRSGESVIPLLNFYKIPVENLCVIQDDIDQTFAQIKLQANRGHGGHNGIRNISELLGHSNYTRLKIGVGRPTIEKMDVADWVLQNFSNEEMATLPKLLEISASAVEALMDLGFAKASTRFNGTSALPKVSK